MKDKLTTQVASAYWGADFKVNNTQTLGGKVSGFLRGSIVDEQGNMFKAPDCQLCLFSLSSLTKEHAIEVAKIAGYDDCKGTDLMVYFRQGHYRRSIDLYEMKIIDHSYSYDCDMDMPLPNVTQIIDYLRKNQYMLPYMGVDLFEAGVAIEKNRP